MFVGREYFVGLEDTGAGSMVGDRALLEMFSNTANLHGMKIGQGSSDPGPFAWVVINWKMEVLRRVKVCSSVRVRTWSQKWDRITANRDFLAFDESGDTLARATSVWMAVDRKRHFPSRLTEEIMGPYGSEPDVQNFPGITFTKPDLLSVPVLRSVPFTVPRCMIDFNGHVHNTAYLDIADEALPEGVPRDELEVCYRREVKAGQALRVEYGVRDGKHDVFIRSEDGTLHAWIELKGR